MNSNPKRSELENWRFSVVLGIIGLVFLFYMFRLFSLQVISGQSFIDRADENRVKDVSEPTQRGIITDRNGFVLARNAPSYNVIDHSSNPR